MPMDLLCRLQSENRRLKEQNADLSAALQIVKEDRQKWWGKAVARGAELFLRESVTPCTFPDCMSARAVRAAGEEYQRGVVEEKERCVEIVQAGIADCKKEGDRDGLAVLAYAKKAISSAPSLVPQVCQWDLHRDQYSDLFHTSCGRAWDKGIDDVAFCPFCGKPVKES